MDWPKLLSRGRRECNTEAVSSLRITRMADQVAILVYHPPRTFLRFAQSMRSSFCRSQTQNGHPGLISCGAAYFVKKRAVSTPPVPDALANVCDSMNSPASCAE